MTEEKCKNCHTELIGRFCHQCGEKQLAQEDRRLRVLFGDLVESLYNIDNRLLRTVWCFFTRPGWLGFQYRQGIRVPYLKPISFFLIVNLLYFLVSPMTDFALSLHNQYAQPYTDFIKPVIEQHMQATNTNLDSLAQAYNPLSQSIAKSIVILAVPFLIPFIWLANPSKRFLLIDHTVIALYLYAFVLVWPILVRAGLELLEVLGKPVVLSQTLLPIFLAVYYLYCVLTQRNMYQSGWLGALFKGFIVFVGIAVSHFIYRFIQFWLVWWQIT